MQSVWQFLLMVQMEVFLYAYQIPKEIADTIMLIYKGAKAEIRGVRIVVRKRCKKIHYSLFICYYCWLRFEEKYEWGISGDQNYRQENLYPDDVVLLKFFYPECLKTIK